MKFAELFVVVLVIFGLGLGLGVAMEKQRGTPKDLWSLCQASPTTVWKAGPLEVRQNPRKHEYTCLMYLDGQGNKLPVKVYAGGELVEARIPMEAVLHVQYDNAQLAAAMASL